MPAIHQLNQPQAGSFVFISVLNDRQCRIRDVPPNQVLDPYGASDHKVSEPERIDPTLIDWAEPSACDGILLTNELMRAALKILFI